MQTLIATVKKDIKAANVIVEKAQGKLNDNFIYNFQWGYAEDLYKNALIVRKLNQFAEFITEQPNRAAEWLSYNINEAKKRILRGGFLGTSTNVYHNLAHTYDKEVDCILIEMYETYITYITGEDAIPVLQNTTNETAN